MVAKLDTINSGAKVSGLFSWLEARRFRELKPWAKNINIFGAAEQTPIHDALLLLWLKTQWDLNFRNQPYIYINIIVYKPTSTYIFYVLSFHRFFKTSGKTSSYWTFIVLFWPVILFCIAVNYFPGGSRITSSIVKFRFTTGKIITDGIVGIQPVWPLKWDPFGLTVKLARLSPRSMIIKPFSFNHSPFGRWLV